METAKLKKFAQLARRSLLEQVSAKLKLVLAENSAARRERADAIKKLEEAIKGHGQEQVIERVAYIWFNRFCALRFMNVNRYTRIGVVSPAEGQFQPEILAEAKMGHIDEEMVHDKVRRQIFALLDGKAPSRDPQGEAYRLLVVAACNFWNKAMPFLFQRIDDYTELLMPDDLLSGNSILAYTREAMTPDVCGVTSDQWPVASKSNTSHQSLATSHSAAAGGVEVIGWLYQFYISEKKDEVFDGLKKNKKITPENIPAATQLFTPHWIVRYLVENSLGRLWLLNRPGSKLVEQMDYYIKPEQAETDFLRINKPEEIKICDPACGSGHMLTYAFDLLYAIYEEEGYEPAEIPEKILTHNLYGIEIDERAGELAAFALTMKAASKYKGAKQRRFFNKGVKPNICVLENVHFDEGELGTVISDQWSVASGASREDILHDLNLFEEADNFGSLLCPRLSSQQCENLRDYLTGHWSLATSHSLFESMTHQKVLQALRQADYLSPKYHVVIANPPYMGGKGMNGRLSAWAKTNCPDSKTDLYSMFIERSLCLALHKGLASLITIQNWMFLSSFERLRVNVLEANGIRSLIQIGYNSFPELNSKVAQAAAFVIQANGKPAVSEYLNLNDAPQAANKQFVFKEKLSKNHVFRVHQRELSDIPGYPIAYWISPTLRSIFSTAKRLGDLAKPRQGLASGDNDRFMRYWHEIDLGNTEFTQTDYKKAVESGFKWFPHNKGGAYRKWFGNNEFVLAFDSENFEALAGMGNHLPSRQMYFKPGMSWTALTSGKFNGRYTECSIFDAKGPVLFANPGKDINYFMGFCNSVVATEILKILAPTLDFNQGPVGNLPIVEQATTTDLRDVSGKSRNCVEISRRDWNAYETSWDFTSLPLLNSDYRQPPLKGTYQKLRAHWREITLEMQRLEEENNRLFIEAYGLQDELKPEVPLNEITLACNPHYRYQLSGQWLVASDQQKEEELEKRLLEDTMKELVSYSVGCMFGRYSLDMPGLVVANQGEILADYLRKVAEYRQTLATGHWPLATNKPAGENHERETLQGSDCLAESHGPGAVGVSDNETVSEGGALRADESGKTSSSVDSVEHSGGASSSISGGVQKLSVDSTGFTGGSRNSTADSNSPQLSGTGATGPNHGSASRSQQNDPSLDVKTGHWPLATSHLSFVPDEDNVIPMLDGDWFTDDIAERFRKFLRVAFGDEHYEANLRFVEQALNIKGKRNYSIRDYFLGEFYTDHVRRYKKRPIYWLFSSPKGSFNALIYMHRYRPDTVSVVLNDYLREFRTKLTSHKNHLEAVSISASSSQAEKTKALKEIEKITKMIAEMEEYEREVLYPLATVQVEIDLDDGVKLNYPKFGAALKKVVGLDSQDDA